MTKTKTAKLHRVQKGLGEMGASFGARSEVLDKLANVAKKDALSKESLAAAENMIVFGACASVLVNGVINAGSGLHGNLGIGVSALYTIMYGFLLTCVEIDRKRDHNKVQKGIVISLTNKRIAKSLIKENRDYAKTLLMGSVVPLAFGWPGAVSMVFIWVRALFLLATK